MACAEHFIRTARMTLLARSSSIRTPQKTGYTFGGYYTHPNGQGDLVVNEDGMVTTTPTYFHEENRNGTEKANVNSKGETTVYAKWTKNQYSFHYIGNGGKTSTGGETISDGVSYNTPYHVRATNNTFYRTGYCLQYYLMVQVVIRQSLKLI